MTTPQDIQKLLNDIDNDESNLNMLERAMRLYCSPYDMCEGYKQAIRLTLHDQYTNHSEDQEENDLDELSDILNGAI